MSAGSKSVLMWCFIVTLVQFGTIQLESEIWSSIATKINRWASKAVDILFRPYTEMVAIIQSSTTKDLCRRNTVQECMEQYEGK